MQSTLPSIHPPVPGEQHRVLLVDDDAVSLELLALMLGCDGHEVLQAANGKAALDLLSQPGLGAPDVLLVDLQMPGISGHELAGRVLAMRGYKPRLLAMSATAVNSRQLRGFDGFLLKPLVLDDLRRALDPKGKPPAAESRLRSKPEQAKLGSEPQSEPPSPRDQKISAWPFPASGATGAANPGRDPGTNEDENIDRAVLIKLSKAMSADSLKELYAACIADSRARVVRLLEQMRVGHVGEIRRSAHQVKGAASMVGATRMAKLAAILEAGSYTEEDTRSLLTDLLDSCDDLERILLAGNLQTSNDTIKR